MRSDARPDENHAETAMAVTVLTADFVLLQCRQFRCVLVRGLGARNAFKHRRAFELFQAVLQSVFVQLQDSDIGVVRPHRVDD